MNSFISKQARTDRVIRFFNKRNSGKYKVLFFEPILSKRYPCDMCLTNETEKRISVIVRGCVYDICQACLETIKEEKFFHDE